MPKIKKIKELKPRIKEIELSKEESELLEDVKEAEQQERETALTRAAETEFKAPSLVLESAIENASSEEPAPAQIQQATRERREMEERNEEMREALGTTTAYAAAPQRRDYRTYSSTAQPMAAATPIGDVQQANVLAQQRAAGFERKQIQAETVQREQEREEQYQTRRQRRRYPWEA